MQRGARSRQTPPSWIDGRCLCTVATPRSWTSATCSFRSSRRNTVRIVRPEEMASVEQAQLMKTVSVDDHLVEPPQLWTDRLPSRYLERGPHVVRTKVLADITNDERG